MDFLSTKSFTAGRLLLASERNRALKSSFTLWTPRETRQIYLSQRINVSDIISDFYLEILIASRDELSKIDPAIKHHNSNNYPEAHINARYEDSGKRSVKKIENRISPNKSPRATDSKFTEGTDSSPKKEHPQKAHAKMKLNPRPMRADFKLPRNNADLAAHFYEFAGSDRLTRQRLKDQLANRYHS